MVPGQEIPSSASSHAGHADYAENGEDGEDAEGEISVWHGLFYDVRKDARVFDWCCDMTKSAAENITRIIA